MRPALWAEPFLTSSGRFPEKFLPAGRQVKIIFEIAPNCADMKKLEWQSDLLQVTPKETYSVFVLFGFEANIMLKLIDNLLIEQILAGKS